MPNLAKVQTNAGSWVSKYALLACAEWVMLDQMVL